jgi:hypothetical protein
MEGRAVTFACPAVEAAPACVWWDAAAAAWSSAGCIVANLSATAVTCACDHLTDFSLRIGAVEVPVDLAAAGAPIFADDAAPLRVLVGGGTGTSLAVVTGLLLVGILGFTALGAARDVRDGRAFAAALARQPELALAAALAALRRRPAAIVSIDGEPLTEGAADAAPHRTHRERRAKPLAAAATARASSRRSARVVPAPAPREDGSPLSAAPPSSLRALEDARRSPRSPEQANVESGGARAVSRGGAAADAPPAVDAARLLALTGALDAARLKPAALLRNGALLEDGPPAAAFALEGVASRSKGSRRGATTLSLEDGADGAAPALRSDAAGSCIPAAAAAPAILARFAAATRAAMAETGPYAPRADAAWAARLLVQAVVDEAAA